MTMRNAIQLTFDEFGKAHGGHKKAGSWYLTGSDSVIVLNLQKSNYSPRYYINFGLWFLGVGPSNDPPPTHCHLQTRVESLVADDDRPRFQALLDLEEIRPDHVRHDELLSALEDWLLPFIKAGSSLSNLETPAGQRLLTRSLLNGDGQLFLAKIIERS
jgi:hypothetical protein